MLCSEPLRSEVGGKVTRTCDGISFQRNNPLWLSRPARLSRPPNASKSNQAERRTLLRALTTLLFLSSLFPVLSSSCSFTAFRAVFICFCQSFYRPDLCLFLVSVLFLFVVVLSDCVLGYLCRRVESGFCLSSLRTPLSCFFFSERLNANELAE